MTQQRHQVFEQRGAPREQHGSAADAGDRSSEVEPVHLRHVALGDREEARQARFRRQQVVVRRIEPARALGIREAVADREQLPLGFVEEPKSMRVEQRRRARAASAGASSLQADRRASAARRRGCRCRPWRHSAGGSGASVRVSYQFSRWPFDRSSASTVVSVASIRPTSIARVDEAEIVSRERRQQAEADVGRRRAMGDRSSGTIWTLSGGRPWSSAPTNVSKYRHVLRATACRYSRSADVSGARRRGTGRLSANAINGAAAHSASTGSATGSARGRTARDDDECANGQQRTRHHGGEERAQLAAVRRGRRSPPSSPTPAVDDA